MGKHIFVPYLIDIVGLVIQSLMYAGRTFWGGPANCKSTASERRRCAAMLQPKIIPEKTDLRRLDWTRVRGFSGASGSFLKASEVRDGRRIYYKLSDGSDGGTQPASHSRNRSRTPIPEAGCGPHAVVSGQSVRFQPGTFQRSLRDGLAPVKRLERPSAGARSDSLIVCSRSGREQTRFR